MKIGLLWFDDDPRKDLEEKVLRAAAHYEHKHGCVPDLCFVHPGAFGDNGDGKPKKAGSVEVWPGRSVLPHHFWLGVAEKKRQPTPAQDAPAKPASVPQPSLTRRVEATEAGKETMTPEEARQLVMALENPEKACIRNGLLV
jgi:hypothetical protein